MAERGCGNVDSSTAIPIPGCAKKHQEQLSSDMPPSDLVKHYLFHRACIAVYGIDVGDVAIWMRDDAGG